MEDEEEQHTSQILKKTLLKPLMVEDNKACLSLLNGKSNFFGPTIAQTK